METERIETESMSQLNVRMKEFYDFLLDKNTKYEKIAVITHYLFTCYMTGNWLSNCQAILVNF